MIVKMMSRSSAKAVIDYITRKDHKPEFLLSKGVRADNTDAMARSFERWAKMLPGRSEPFLHTSFSLALEDKNISYEKKVAILFRWAELMGYDHTQMAAWEHHDHEYIHWHAIMNRVNNNGHWIRDGNERYRNMKACKTLAHEFGLVIVDGKRKVKPEQLKGKDKFRYEMYAKVKAALDEAITWTDFKEELAKRGITMQFRWSPQRHVVQGIVFSDGSKSYAGSSLDRSFSFRNLDRELGGLSSERDYYDVSFDRDADGGLLHPDMAAADRSSRSNDRGIGSGVSILGQENPAYELTSNAFSSIVEGTTDLAESVNGIAYATLDALVEVLAVPLAPSVEIGSGGGGSQSDLPWGRDKDEEDEKKRSRVNNQHEYKHKTKFRR